MGLATAAPQWVAVEGGEVVAWSGRRSVWGQRLRQWGKATIVPVHLLAWCCCFHDQLAEDFRQMPNQVGYPQGSQQPGAAPEATGSCSWAQPYIGETGRK